MERQTTIKANPGANADLLAELGFEGDEFEGGGTVAVVFGAAPAVGAAMEVGTAAAASRYHESEHIRRKKVEDMMDLQEPHSCCWRLKAAS